jgi:serine/threonine-protein kinase
MIVKTLKIFAIGLGFAAVVGASAYLTLTLMIGRAKTVVVPDLVGKDIVYALQFLSELELNTKIRGTEHNPDIPKNHVIYQDPGPGSEIKQGRDVRLILSKGAASVTMPELVRLAFQQAELLLEKNDICVGKIAYAFSGSVEENRIVAQFPAAGSRVESGSCSDLLVSKGSRPKRLRMPLLTGVSYERAMLRLEEANVSIGDIRAEQRNTQPPDVVIDQSPPAGYPLSRATPVELVVNRRSRGGEAYREMLPAYAELFQYRLENGYLSKRIRVELESDGDVLVLYNDFAKPGEEIWLMVPTGKNAVVSVYENDQLVKTRHYAGGKRRTGS